MKENSKALNIEARKDFGVSAVRMDINVTGLVQLHMMMEKLGPLPAFLREHQCEGPAEDVEKLFVFMNKILAPAGLGKSMDDIFAEESAEQKGDFLSLFFS